MISPAPSVLAWLLAACAPEPPRVPARVEAGDAVFPAVAPGWGLGATTGFYDLPEGVMVRGGLLRGSVLLRNDGRAEYLPLSAGATDLDTMGWFRQLVDGGETAWNHRTRAWGAVPSPRTVVQTLENGQPLPPLSQRRRRGDLEVRHDGGGRLVLSRPGQPDRVTEVRPARPWLGMSHVEFGGDGTVHVVFGQAGLGTWNETSVPVPQSVHTLDLATWTERPGDRFDLPEVDDGDAEAGPWQMLRDLRWSPQGVVGLVGGRVGSLRGGRFEPAPDVPPMLALHRDARDRVWAGWREVWCYEGGSWKRVLDEPLTWGWPFLPLLAGRPDEAGWAYEFDTARVRRLSPTPNAHPGGAHSGPPMIRVAEDGSRSFAQLALDDDAMKILTHQVRRGRGVPAVNAAVLRDGDRLCGERAHPFPFRVLLGDCDDWVGLTTLGAVLAGDAARVQVLSPPVGIPLSLARVGDHVVVGGDEAVAWTVGTEWVRIPVRAPVPSLDAALSWGKVVAWFSQGPLLCRTRGGEPTCWRANLDQAPEPLQALVAWGDHAWLTDGTTLYRADPDGPTAIKEGTFRSLLPSVPRHLLWVTTGDALLAIHPESGALERAWPGVEGSFGGVDAAGNPLLNASDHRLFVDNWWYPVQERRP